MSLDFTNDPWGAWGSLIGTVLGQSYNKNAQERERAKADKIIDEMRNQQVAQRVDALRNANIEDESAGQAIANNMAQQAGAQGAQQATGFSINTPNIDFMGQGVQYAQQQNPYQFSLPALNNKPQLGKDYAVNKALEANQKALNSEKTAQAVLAAADPTAQARYNWNPDYTEDNVRKKLRAADVRQEIIDEKLGEARKDIARRADEVLLPSIRKKLFYGYDTVEKDKDGNLYTVHHNPDYISYMQASAELEQLKQYAPETYKTYMRQVVLPKDLYAANEYDRRYKQQRDDRREDAKTNRQWNREDKDTDFKRKVYWDVVKAEQKKNSKNSIAVNDYKEALKRRSEIEAYYEEQRSTNPNFELPSGMQKEWETNNAIINQYLNERAGGNGNSNNTGDGETPVDWNDWNSIMAGIDQAKADGHSAKEILTLVESKLGKDHPWYKNIASSFNHDPKRKEEEDKAERQRQLNESLFPKEYTHDNRKPPVISDGWRDFISAPLFGGGQSDRWRNFISTPLFK